jgi:hypothetical protein
MDRNSLLIRGDASLHFGISIYTLFLHKTEAERNGRKEPGKCTQFDSVFGILTVLADIAAKITAKRDKFSSQIDHEATRT